MSFFNNPGTYYDFTTAPITTTSLTAVNVSQMLFQINPNGSVQKFEFTLIVGSDTVAGLKIALAVPSGASFRAWAIGSGASKNALVVDLMTQSGVLGAAFNTFNGQNNYLSVRGALIAGNASGNIQLQAAKVTSGTATLAAGSYFIAQLL